LIVRGVSRTVATCSPPSDVGVILSLMVTSLSVMQLLARRPNDKRQAQNDA
jgi:hypothetical protein